MSKIIFQSKGAVGTIILNNPKKLNAFDAGMFKELDNALEEIKKSELKAVVLRGAGKSFCSGGDILWEKEIGELDVKEAKKQMGFAQTVLSKIEAMEQVFVALIQGYAVGGGNELAMACDIRIALESANFMHPETSLGTVAPLGGTKRLPRLIGLGKAKYMLFTGNVIDSKTALRWGLADFVVSEKESENFLSTLLDKITSQPKRALALTKKSVNREHLGDFKDDFELKSYVECSRTEENKARLDKFFENKKKSKKA
ncbi:enoyl-CoA hydratase/isomerase family protein [Candidatus Woesearchaeota archaeon]|nr:enoyl-CoA hydratase/isomerase family protein [Candidatus Woesearchaeota archaeon]